MADGQADPVEPDRLLGEIGPRISSQYGVFTCGGSDGSGSIYAAMAAAAKERATTFPTWHDTTRLLVGELRAVVRGMQ